MGKSMQKQRPPSKWSFFFRDLFELVGSVYILGFLPFGAHALFSLERPHDDRSWMAPELYLFVMVTSGATMMTAWRDRNADGPFRSIAFLGGLVGLLGGAAAYGLLYSDPQSAQIVNLWLRSSVLGVVAAAGLFHVTYQIPGIWEDALAEEMEKRAS